jgi:hypothetical protein
MDRECYRVNIRENDKRQGAILMKHSILLIFTLLLVSILYSCNDIDSNDLDSDHRNGKKPDRFTTESNSIGEKGVSVTELKGRIKIKKIGKFDFDPKKIESVTGRT